MRRALTKKIIYVTGSLKKISFLYNSTLSISEPPPQLSNLHHKTELGAQKLKSDIINKQRGSYEFHAARKFALDQLFSDAASVEEISSIILNNGDLITDETLEEASDEMLKKYIDQKYPELATSKILIQLAKDTKTTATDQFAVSMEDALIYQKFLLRNRCLRSKKYFKGDFLDLVENSDFYETLSISKILSLVEKRAIKLTPQTIENFLLMNNSWKIGFKLLDLFNEKTGISLPPVMFANEVMRCLTGNSWRQILDLYRAYCEQGRGEELTLISHLCALRAVIKGAKLKNLLCIAKDTDEIVNNIKNITGDAAPTLIEQVALNYNYCGKSEKTLNYIKRHSILPCENDSDLIDIESPNIAILTDGVLLQALIASLQRKSWSEFRYYMDMFEKFRYSDISFENYYFWRALLEAVDVVQERWLFNFISNFVEKRASLPRQVVVGITRVLSSAVVNENEKNSHKSSDTPCVLALQLFDLYQNSPLLPSDVEPVERMYSYSDLFHGIFFIIVNSAKSIQTEKAAIESIRLRMTKLFDPQSVEMAIFNACLLSSVPRSLSYKDAIDILQKVVNYMPVHGIALQSARIGTRYIIARSVLCKCRTLKLIRARQDNYAESEDGESLEWEDAYRLLWHNQLLKYHPFDDISSFNFQMALIIISSDQCGANASSDLTQLAFTYLSATPLRSCLGILSLTEMNELIRDITKIPHFSDVITSFEAAKNKRKLQILKCC